MLTALDPAAKARICCTGRTIGEQIECGRHSEIPDCCIYFFCTWWQENCESARHEDYELLRKVAERIHGYEKVVRSWGYVACPTCLLTGRKVKLAACPITCPRGRARSKRHHMAQRHRVEADQC